MIEAGDLIVKSHNIQEGRVENVGMEGRVENVRKVGNATARVMTVKRLDTLLHNISTQVVEAGYLEAKSHNIHEGREESVGSKVPAVLVKEDGIRVEKGYGLCGEEEADQESEQVEASMSLDGEDGTQGKEAAGVPGEDNAITALEQMVASTSAKAEGT